MRSTSYCFLQACLIHLFFIAVPAHAVIVRVDSDDFAVGTNLTETLSGVTVTNLSQSSGLNTYAPTRSDVSTFECTGNLSLRCAYDAGPTAFATSWDLFNFEGCVEGVVIYCGWGFSVVEFILDSPTDFFEISFGWGPDGPGVMFYDVDDNLIERCLLPFGSPFGSCGDVSYSGEYRREGSTSTVMSLALSEARIARVVAGGVIVPVTINSFGYSVPAPGPFGLFVFGLAILGIRRRLAA